MFYMSSISIHWLFQVQMNRITFSRVFALVWGGEDTILEFIKPSLEESFSTFMVYDNPAN